MTDFDPFLEKIARVCGIEPKSVDKLAKKHEKIMRDFREGKQGEPIDMIGRIIVDDNLDGKEKVMLATLVGFEQGHLLGEFDLIRKISTGEVDIEDLMGRL